MLYSPQSFGCVEDGVYRSGFPTELNFSFLESLNLKTVVILSPENVEDQFISFLKDCGIHVVYIHNAANADGFHGLSAVAEETIIEALNIITKNVNLPALITCRTGKTLTGVVVGKYRTSYSLPLYLFLTFSVPTLTQSFNLMSFSQFNVISIPIVGCLRKLQRWSFISLFEEYRRYACGGLCQRYSLQNQQHEQFMELFDTDLVAISDDTAPEFMKRS